MPHSVRMATTLGAAGVARLGFARHRGPPPLSRSTPAGGAGSRLRPPLRAAPVEAWYGIQEMILACNVGLLAYQVARAASAQASAPTVCPRSDEEVGGDDGGLRSSSASFVEFPDPPRDAADSSEATIDAPRDLWEEVSRQIDVGGDVASLGPRQSQQPRLLLQCLARKDRTALMGSSLAILKAKVAAAPCDAADDADAAKGGTPWRARCVALLDACVADACEAWLGFVPRRDPDAERAGPSAPASPWDDKLELYAAAFAALEEQEGEEEGKGRGEGGGVVQGWNSASGLGAAACAAALQDCVVAIAEGAAEAYVIEVCRGGVGIASAMAVDGEEDGVGKRVREGPSALHGPEPTFLNPIVDSTRKLERFRNQVAVHRMIHRYVHSVQHMYEDRYGVWSFTRDGGLVEGSLRMPRQRQLGRLRGLRRLVGLTIEAADVAIPLMKRVLSFVNEGISSLLVLVIGRGIGLVVRGVRESITREGSSGARGREAGGKGGGRGNGKEDSVWDGMAGRGRGGSQPMPWWGGRVNWGGT